MAVPFAQHRGLGRRLILSGTPDSCGTFTEHGCERLLLDPRFRFIDPLYAVYQAHTALVTEVRKCEFSNFILPQGRLDHWGPFQDPSMGPKILMLFRISTSISVRKRQL